MSHSMDGVKRIALSYPLTRDAPYPDGGRPLRISGAGRMADGDISNSSMVEFWNHIGTHMDGPGHVLAGSGDVANYAPASGLFFCRSHVLDVPCENDRLITAFDLEAAEAALTDCDLLLIRTGFAKYRRSEAERYAGRNPGIDMSAAQYVVERYSSVQCIGIDTISFAAAAYVQEGIAAHRILLGRRPPILLIEDMNLAHDLEHLKRVMVVPLLIEGLDSCPCVVIGELAKGPLEQE